MVVYGAQQVLIAVPVPYLQTHKQAKHEVIGPFIYIDHKEFDSAADEYIIRKK